MRSEPFVTDITPVAGMSQAGMSCCLPSLHMLCLIILIGRMSLNSFGFGSFLVYQSINLYHTSMTPLSRLCVLGMPCIAFLAFCSVVACRSPAFQVSCWWLCSTSQDNRLKLVTMRQCDNVLCLTSFFDHVMPQELILQDLECCFDVCEDIEPGTHHLTL